MDKVKDIKKCGGRVEIFEDVDKKLLLAKPRRIANPSLLAEVIKEAKIFSTKVKGEWTYVANLEKVWCINPLALRKVQEIKTLTNLKHIVLYLPRVHTRWFFYLVKSFLPIKPERIITDKKVYHDFLKDFYK